ncbi:MAG TPA: DUF2630 family protein [Ktedonobacterales bacterium]|jgi:hypothetical protein|nr:DUF2630 family protein [Ktedonobacterales bacterium]
MNDSEVLQHINALVDEEHELLKAAEHGGLDEEQHDRLQQVKVSLDQCWDLLRQRRAHREFGQNPDDAAVRDPKIVEGYKG